MKVRAELKKKLKKRSHTIDFLLGKPVWEFTLEDFHKLRTEIKKLKALYKLVHFCSKKMEWKKEFKPFRSIFKQAGKVRELHVEEASLKKYVLYKGLKKHLQNLKKARLEEKRIFFLLINANLRNRLKKSNNKVFTLIKIIDKNDPQLYLNKKRKEIKNLILGKQLKIERAHELRKLIKEFHYTIKNLNFSKQIKLVEETEPLQNLLGKWHDCEVIKQHLNEAIVDKVAMGTSELKQIKRVKIKLSADCEILFKKINTAVYKERVLKSLTSKVI
ncbi:MAG: CHAD domain-containing protein [Bacteroidetes bacterium]|nr:CHAD domain-containing protein [Bacteroidota bacterium]